MNLRVLTLSIDPETGQFPDDPLADIDGELLAVDHHVVTYLGEPRLVLVAQVRAQRSVTVDRHGRTDWRLSLGEVERARFDRLRSWRNSKASAEGLSPYVILNNRQLAEIARQMPTTAAALEAIPGIGSGRTGKYAAEIFAVLTHG